MSAPILYVCLLSEYTVATVQALAHLRPAHILAISSPRMTASSRRFRTVLENLKVIGERAHGGTVLEILGEDTDVPFPAQSLKEAGNWMQRHLVSRLEQLRSNQLRPFCNITGSTKAAALALKECWEWSEIHYSPEDQRDCLETLAHPQGYRFGLPALPPLEELRLLADKVLPLPDPWSGQSLLPFAQRILQDYEAGPEASVLFRHEDLLRHIWFDGEAPPAAGNLPVQSGRVLLPPGPLTDLLADLAALDPGSCDAEGGGLWVPAKRDHRWVSFVVGHWWEAMVGDWLRSAGCPTIPGVRIVRQDGGPVAGDSDLDVVVRCESGQLLAVECKVSPPGPRDLGSLVRTLNDLTRALGKTPGAFALSPAFWWKVQPAAQASFLDACQQRQIKIVESRAQLLELLGKKRTPWPEYQPSEVFRPIQQILADMHRAVCDWKPEAAQRLTALGEECERAYPAQADQARRLIQARPVARQLLEKAYREGNQGVPLGGSPLLEKARALSIQGLERQIQVQWKKGDKSRQRHAAEVSAHRRGEPLSRVQARPHQAVPFAPRVPTAGRHRCPPPPPGLHPNDIRALRPGPGWTLLLDETGSDFGDDRSAKQPGRFVGLLVPRESPALEPLPNGWHSVDCVDPREIDEVVQRLLDAPVGILGLPVSALPRTVGERWLDGMRALVDWVLRILPLDGPTRLEVFIEARPPFRPGMEPDAVRRDAQALLARAWPERAQLIDLCLATVPKDGHPLLSYVDALAFTWGSTSQASRERLRRSGLGGTCLLTLSPESLAAAWDTWDQPGGLAPSVWVELAGLPEARQPASLAGSILAAWAESCRSDAARWQSYLRETERQMGVSPVDLRLTGALVDWLEAARPPEKALPPAIRLVWLTIALARANHHGQTEVAWEEELRALAERLRVENAPLCCHADLHRAVARTHHFAFAQASAVLEPWRAIDPAVPGLGYWAEVRSSLGQHHAFRGEYPQAHERFEEALEAFARLSEAGRRDKNLEQTRCYRVLARMDDPAVDDHAARATLIEWLGDLSAAAGYLSTSELPDRYLHHTLLRFLVFRGEPAIATAYLAHRKDWSDGEGHPWPLIHLYRGLLLRPLDPPAAREYAIRGANSALAPEQGPILRLIGACGRAIAHGWGAPWVQGRGEVATLRQQMPGAPDRLDTLAAYLEKPGDPLGLLRAVLPFSFR